MSKIGPEIGIFKQNCWNG